MKIRITRIDPRASVPAYHTSGAAGFDIAILDNITIPPHEAAFAHTGLGFGTPQGYVLLIFPRSSIFKKYGVMLANSVGVLDEDYAGAQDELRLHIYNPTHEPITIAAGERVAQGLFTPILRAEWEEADAQGPSRGGFGSTG